MNILLPEPVCDVDVPDGYEMVDGELVEVVMGAEAGYVAGQLISLLRTHCAANPVGWPFPSEVGYQLFSNRPKLVRKPDVSFVRLGRLPEETLPRGNIRFAPDLAVEVVSPNDLYYEVDTKVAEYRAAGVPLIWIISPPTRRVLIRRGGTISEIGENDELSGEDVIPRFRCRVAELFQPPLGVNPTAPVP
jgi:Uma2 family endonuclease